ncbi:FMN-binding protein [Actinomyces howellii]|uniref:Major membrane immunogen, membrane-anchored lipoprotein n=1 Tax=Actinomyces howellii TaxID=52771 RepID=A0A3S4T978_9ACTO|nr:FMN-binding protein [Actinomyces howellii]VEG27179.1 Major membrane immunogen, membrane-anchored lipoprotein [Actinomyces howellii]
MRPTTTGAITAGATILGVAAVIACSPTPQGTSVATTAGSGSVGSETTAADQAQSGSEQATTEASGSAQTSAQATTDSATGTSSGASGTFQGETYESPYGPMQVEITVADGTITEITWIQLPSDGHSERINESAAPTLVEEGLAAQSADVASVSGATYTSEAFTTSLQSAMTQAGL